MRASIATASSWVLRLMPPIHSAAVRGGMVPGWLLAVRDASDPPRAGGRGRDGWPSRGVLERDGEEPLVVVARVGDRVERLEACTDRLQRRGDVAHAQLRAGDDD